MSPTNNKPNKPNKAVLSNNPKKPITRRWHKMPIRIEQAIIEEVAKGRTCASLAKQYRCNPQTIHYRLKARGFTVAGLRKEYDAKPKTVLFESKTGDFPPIVVPSISVPVSPKSKSSLRMLAFYLGVTEQEVVDAAISKYHQLQQTIAREMIAKGTPWRGQS